MPNFSGLWTVRQQMQAKGASTWPATPGAPTIGTATAGTSLCASVTFTAPVCTGFPTTLSYRATSTPGCFTNTGASSPIVVSGLTVGTSYTFKVKAINSTGTGPCSAASNSITAVNKNSQSYTSPGCYTWVAPSGVTSVSIVAVGGGGTGYNFYGAGGGGGGLGYRNNYSVTPGNSYAVRVGASGSASGSSPGTASYFINTSTVAGYGGGGGGGIGGTGGSGGSYVGNGGGNGGSGGSAYANSGCNPFGAGAGGGAGGYAGSGGAGATASSSASVSGSCGSGGGGGGGASGYCSGGVGYSTAGGGGGVGLLGQGSSGASGVAAPSPTHLYPSTISGKGGSGGCNAQAYTYNLAGYGGAYGGGAGNTGGSGTGGSGAVRIVWPGNTRTFPSTDVGSP